MKAVKIDLLIQKGATFRRVYQLKQSDGTPVNLTNFQIRSYMRHTFDSTAFVDLHASIVDAITGKWKLELSDAETSALTFTTGVYDVELVCPEVVPITFGNVLIRPEVTR